MRRRRKGDSAALGYIIILVLVIAAFGWIKENVVDYTKGQFWIVVGVVAALLITIKVRQASVRRAREAAERAQRAEARREYLEWGAKRAVEIATYQKWVSPNRLSAQAQLTVTQGKRCSSPTFSIAA